MEDTLIRVAIPQDVMSDVFGSDYKEYENTLIYLIQDYVADEMFDTLKTVKESIDEGLHQTGLN